MKSLVLSLVGSLLMQFAMAQSQNIRLKEFPLYKKIAVIDKGHLYLMTSDFRPVAKLNIGDSLVREMSLIKAGKSIILIRDKSVQQFNIDKNAIVYSQGLPMLKCSQKIKIEYEEPDFVIITGESFLDPEVGFSIKLNLARPDQKTVHDVTKKKLPDNTAIIESILGKPFRDILAEADTSTAEQMQMRIPFATELLHLPLKRELFQLWYHGGKDTYLTRSNYKKANELIQILVAKSKIDSTISIESRTPINTTTALFLWGTIGEENFLFKYNIDDLQLLDKVHIPKKYKHSFVSYDGSRLYLISEGTYFSGTEIFFNYPNDFNDHCNTKDIYFSNLTISILDLGNNTIVDKISTFLLFNEHKEFGLYEREGIDTTKTQSVISLFTSPRHTVDTVLYRPGLSYFITTNRGSEIVVWSKAERKPLKLIKSVGLVQFINDSSFLHLKTYEEIEIVNLYTGLVSTVFRLPAATRYVRILDFRISPKENYLIVYYTYRNTTNFIKVIDLRTAKEVQSIQKDLPWDNKLKLDGFNFVLNDSIYHVITRNYVGRYNSQSFHEKENNVEWPNHLKLVGYIEDEVILKDSVNNLFSKVGTSNLIRLYDSRESMAEVSYNDYNDQYINSGKLIINLKSGTISQDTLKTIFLKKRDKIASNQYSYYSENDKLWIYDNSSLEVEGVYNLPKSSMLLNVNHLLGEALLLDTKSLIYFNYKTNLKRVFKSILSVDEYENYKKGKVRIEVDRSLDFVVIANDQSLGLTIWWPLKSKVFSDPKLDYYGGIQISNDSKYVGLYDESMNLYLVKNATNGKALQITEVTKEIRKSLIANTYFQNGAGFNERLYSITVESRGGINQVFKHSGDSVVSKTSYGVFDYRKQKKELWFNFISIGSDFLVYLDNGMFDCSPSMFQNIYFTRGLETVELKQLKERFYEPNLLKKLVRGEKLRSVVGMKSIELPPYISVGQVDEKGYLPVDLTNRGGGIGEVTVLINGKEVIADARPKGSDSKSSKLSLKVFIGNHKSLVKGIENFVAVKAWNAGHWVVSRGTVVSYRPTGSETAYEPAIHIITSGISDYTGTELDLKYAAKDAEDVGKALSLGAKNLFGTERSYVYSLTTNSTSDKLPSKANLFKAFQKVSSTAHPLDVVVVYLSGHGINHGGQDGDWYYLTQEAYTSSSTAYNDPEIRKSTTLSSLELVELFKTVPALKQVLMIDACASGKVVESLMAKKDIESSTLRALDRMRDRTGLHIITGCTADAVSYEASKYGQGILTYSLLEGIRGAALREDQFVDINKLFQYAHDRVPLLAEGIGGIQTPQVFSPQGAQSFDIGRLDESSKVQIPIAKIRPVYIRSTFLDEDQLEDALQLGKKIDDALTEVASKGANSTIIFVDVREYPEGCKLSGKYKQEQGAIKLKLRKKCEGKDETIDVEGKTVGEIQKAVLDNL